MATNASEYANIPRYGTAARSIKKGIWVHLNHQYDDAVKVLNNPNHVVSTALTDEQMETIEAEAKNALINASSSFFSRVAVIVLGAALILVVGYVVFGVLSA